MADPYSSRPWTKFYDAQVPASIQYPAVSYWEHTQKAFERFPNRVCFYYMGRSLTFKQVDILSNKFAAYLKKNGIKKGDVVGVHLPNLPAYYISLIGILKAGCILSGVSPLLTAEELENQLKDSGAKALVTADVFFPLVKQVLPHTKVKLLAVTGIADYLPPIKATLGKLLKKIPTGQVTTIEGVDVRRFTDIMKEMPADKIEEKVRPDDICVIQYTGGTTGLPKGALITHRNVVGEVHQVAKWLDIREGQDIGMTAAPFFHTAGLAIGMSFFATGMSQIAVPDPRNQEFIVSAIKKYKPNIVGQVPTIYLELIKRPDFRALDFKPVRVFFSGAAPFPAEHIREFESVVGGSKLVEIFGMTETIGGAIALPLYGKKKTGSVGFPWPDVEVKLVDPETGEIVPIGEPGELLMRGPQILSKGYYNKPEETAHAIRDGWMHSGDVFKMDEDCFFFVVDRLKDMVNVSGYKVFTRELDEVIQTHPDVAMAASVGIPNFERPGAEMVASAIVLKPGVARDAATKKKITEYIREKVAPYKVPKVIEFMDQLPISAVGKILKREIRSTMSKKT